MGRRPGLATAGIDGDAARRALVRALQQFALEIDAKVIAERVETAAEEAMIRDIGIPFGEGYLLGRPGPLPAAVPTSA